LNLYGYIESNVVEE